MNTKIYGLALGALVGGMLASCTNELNEPTFGRVDGNGSVNLVHAPDVVAWSGDQYLDDNTRSNLSTRTADPQANMWADTWQVPNPLTDSQKDIVRQYFQAIKNPQGVAINFSDFFVQDVYKGGTKIGSNSPESYPAANGSSFGSNNMDKLTAGSGEDHINNYNNAQCSTNHQVWDGTMKDEWNKNLHSDEIMLMVNSSTDCFGYHNSACSYQHNDRYVIISGATIEAWANSNGLSCNPSISNKYFVGFDFSMRPKDVVTSTETMKYSNAPGQPKYVKTGTTYTQVDPNNNILYNGEPVHFLVTEMNFYCGEVRNLNDAEFIEDYNSAKCLKMDVINELLAQGYLPVKDKDLRTWVKYEDCADGYYSDWVVCITKGLKKGETPENNTGGTTGGNGDTTGGTTTTPTDPTDPSEPTGPTTPENPTCDKCGHDAHGNWCDVCPENEGCNDPKYYKKGSNEVEVNLSILDDHQRPGKPNDAGDLWSKLSIHVRKGTDVRIVMPIPSAYVVESDDFAIFQKHLLGEDSHNQTPVLSEDQKSHSITYSIVGESFKQNIKDRYTGVVTEIVNNEWVGKSWSIILTVTFNEENIIVETQNIDQDLIDYLMAKNGDGINFEIWTYFESEEHIWDPNNEDAYKAEHGYVQAKEVNREDLRRKYNDSTIEFLDSHPCYYINSFGFDGQYFDWTEGDKGKGEGHYTQVEKNPWDCTVSVVGHYTHRGTYPHLNGTSFNEVYEHTASDCDAHKPYDPDGGVQQQ